jgi:hypothetical protein
MRLQALQKLIRWDQFDSVVNLLQGFGWAVIENVDGPDVRIASFVLDGHILWLFFDDLMGGYLKTEELTLDLKTIEAKIDIFLKSVFFYNRKDGSFAVLVRAVSEWEGFDKLIQFLKNEYSVEILQCLDAPDMRQYRRWVLKAEGHTFELIHDDFFGNTWGNSIVAPTIDSRDIVRKIGLDLEKRLEGR